MTREQSNRNRRDFFRSVLRNLALGGMAGASAFLLTRKPRPADELLCTNERNCRTCSKCCKCPLSQYESPGCGPGCSTRE